jgi:hypothetical protein
MKRAIALVLLLAACSSSSAESAASAPSRTASASPSAASPMSQTAATPSVSPSAAPTASPSGSSDTTRGLDPDSIAEVVTTDLVMRSLPGVTSDSIILDRVLQPNDRLFVIEGPEEATGYEWYHVQLLEEGKSGAVGWVAAASGDGEAWIASSAIACPDADQSDAFELDTFHRLELLSCLGERQIRITVQAMGICAGIVPGLPNFTIEPMWLGMGSTCGWGREENYLSTMQPFLMPSVGSDYPPGAERLDWYRLTGQFDHPDAESCVLRELSDGHPDMPPVPDLTREEVVLLCRSHFAVERAERAVGP